METAVEDRAALPAILGFMKSHAQTAVMQEMVFGHSPRWIAKAGKSQLEPGFVSVHRGSKVAGQA